MGGTQCQILHHNLIFYNRIHNDNDKTQPLVGFIINNSLPLFIFVYKYHVLLYVASWLPTLSNVLVTSYILLTVQLDITVAANLLYYSYVNTTHTVSLMT